MAIDKYNGDGFGMVLTFEHIGAAEQVDCGVGVNWGSNPYWLFTHIDTSDDANWTSYSTLNLIGLWDSDLPNDRLVDVLKFIQFRGGPQDIGGQGFIIADWDRDVYRNLVEIGVSEFRDLSMPTSA